MTRRFFIKTERIGFSRWTALDTGLAEALWGDPKVTKLICATGVFTKEDIARRLATEIRNGEEYIL